MDNEKNDEVPQVYMNKDELIERIKNEDILQVVSSDSSFDKLWIATKALLVVIPLIFILIVVLCISLPFLVLLLLCLLPLCGISKLLKYLKRENNNVAGDK